MLDPGSVLSTATTIVAVGPRRGLDADPRAAGAEVVDATGHAVLPGLHNCHLHSGLLRGTAESMSLWDWLRTYVDPAHKALTPEIARAASLHCYAESLLAGHHVGHGHVAVHGGLGRVAAELGIRATLVPYVADEEGYDYFETIDSNRALLERPPHGAADGRVRAWVGLEHLLYCSPGVLRRGRGAGRGVRHRASTPTRPSRSGRCRSRSTRFGRRPIEVFAPPGHPRPAHGRRPLRLARRPRDRAAGRRPAPRSRTARART